MEILKPYLDIVAIGFEAAGVITIVAGSVAAFIRYIFPIQKFRPRSYKTLRQDLGRGILLGLELLIAGDIIATVLTGQTMDKVLALGVIILIRTFLSISIEMEIDGKFPWQKGTTGG
jgi:uncharacterized membrane protein